MPWDANPRLYGVSSRCGCIGMGPGLGRVLKTRLGVYGIVEPWKQKDRIQIGYGLSETQDKAKARHARAPSAPHDKRSGYEELEWYWLALREQADRSIRCMRNRGTARWAAISSSHKRRWGTAARQICETCLQAVWCDGRGVMGEAARLTANSSATAELLSYAQQGPC